MNRHGRAWTGVGSVRWVMLDADFTRERAANSRVIINCRNEREMARRLTADFDAHNLGLQRLPVGGPVDRQVASRHPVANRSGGAGGLHHPGGPDSVGDRPAGDRPLADWSEAALDRGDRERDHPRAGMVDPYPDPQGAAGYGPLFRRIGATYPHRPA